MTNNQAETMNDDSTIISISKLNKWYGNFHALKDIDLEVEDGEAE